MTDLPEYIQRHIMPIPFCGCWIWMGTLAAGGYGWISFEGRSRPAHRVVYQLLRGIEHPELDADHLCRVRACVNPDHIEFVTNRVNILRGEGASALNLRKTHCDYGHPLSGDNLYIYAKRNERLCMECIRRRRREFWQRRKLREAAHV